MCGTQGHSLRRAAYCRHLFRRCLCIPAQELVTICRRSVSLSLSLSLSLSRVEHHTHRTGRQARRAGGKSHLASVIVEHLQRREVLLRHSWLSNDPLGDQAVRNLFDAVGESRNRRIGGVVLAAVCEHELHVREELLDRRIGRLSSTEWQTQSHHPSYIRNSGGAESSGCLIILVRTYLDFLHDGAEVHWLLD